MTAKQLLNSFIYAMESGKKEDAQKLFSNTAIIKAPIGEISSNTFLDGLYSENKKILTHVYNVLENGNNSSAAYLKMTEFKKIGITVVFECAAFIESAENCIEKMSIIFDTHPIRENFPQLF